MCSERDSPLKRLYRRTHAKLTRLAGFGQLVWAAGCELSLALVHARRDQARHPRQYFGWPRRAKRGRPITHEWTDPWTLLRPGQHRWAQVGATDEPREFRLAGSRQDKRLEKAITLTCLAHYVYSIHIMLLIFWNGKYSLPANNSYFMIACRIPPSLKISFTDCTIYV